MPSSKVAVTLIGGPTVLIDYCGLRFLTDPTFDHAGEEYPSSGVTLRKLTEPAFRPAALGRVDAVLLSHDQHKDNLDVSGRAFLAEVPLVLTTGIGAHRLDNETKGLAVWESLELQTPTGQRVRVTATPCRHGPAGIEPIAGDVIGFLLEALDGSAETLYVTGDTVFYEGVAEVARRFSPRHIIAFAGAARPRGPFDLTMSANDVLDTAHAFPQATIIPVHSEGWEHFTLPAEALAEVFARLGLSDRLRLIAHGETISL